MPMNARYLIPVAILLLAGCTESGPRMYDVEGTVTYRGAPLATGIVKFIPESGPPSPAAIRADGRFKTKAVAGKHTVTVVAMSQPPGARPNAGAEGGIDYSGAGPICSLIPEKYNLPHSSGIVKIVEASDDNVIDIQLQ